MGKNNRARRAAKARARREQRPPGHGPRRTDPDVDELVQIAVHELARGVPPFRVREIRALHDAPADLVRRSIAAEFGRAIVALWTSGWQPTELVRQARRTGSGAGESLVRSAIAADHARRAPATLDPRWADQITQLSLSTDGPGDDGRWVAEWSERHHADPAAGRTAALEVIASLRVLPRLDVLIPPPGTGTSFRPVVPRAADHEVDRAVLDKVRALLTKAESTTFEAEADAFTAKAHELMTRHAIDSAMLAAAGSRTHGGDSPITVRMPVDDPYADAKSLLLQVIATASRCRAISHVDLAMSSVVGFPADVHATEVLYTSLLLQAQSALAEAGRSATAGARTRSRSFRAAFLIGYVQRIGERLSEVTERLVAEAEASSGRSLLPVLRSRGAAIDDHVRERYTRLVSKPVRGGHDPLGWVTGQQAGDAADLARGRLAG